MTSLIALRLKKRLIKKIGFRIQFFYIFVMLGISNNFLTSLIALMRDKRGKLKDLV